MKFKVGDIVTIKKIYLTDKDRKGIIRIIYSDNAIGVEMNDKNFNGHNLDNLLPNNNGWFFNNSKIELAEEKNWKKRIEEQTSYLQ